MSLLPYLERVVERENLSSEEALAAMETILSGEASHPQIAAFLVALRMKGETPGEVAGLSEVMLRRATPISVPGELVDLVGTGCPFCLAMIDLGRKVKGAEDTLGVKDVSELVAESLEP